MTALNIWDWQVEGRRPSWDEFFMMMAEVAATRGTCDRGPQQRFREHKGTGAVIVSADHRRMAIGYVGSPPGSPHCDEADHVFSDGHCIRTLHAEENAILNAPFSLSGCILYCTTAPCYDCCKRIVAVGISRVVYANNYNSRYMGCEEAMQLLESSGVGVDKLVLRKRVDFVGASNATF